MRGSRDASPKDCNLRHTQIRDVHVTQKHELLRPYDPQTHEVLGPLTYCTRRPISNNQPHHMLHNPMGFLDQAQHCSDQA